jgi:hypothetical protein
MCDAVSPVGPHCRIAAPQQYARFQGSCRHASGADIAFGSNTSASFVEAGSLTSGTLTVTDSTHIANIVLLGQYMTGNFHLTNDGHGGTLVTDPPAAATSDLNPVGLVSEGSISLIAQHLGVVRA